MSYELKTMSSLRVCIVSPLFHPNTGGPGRQSYIMAEKLNEKGVALSVITRKLDITPPLINGIEILYVKTVRPDRYNLLEFSFLNLLISLSFSFGTLSKLLFLRNQYKEVHFFGGGVPLLICLPFLKLLRKKIAVKLAGAERGMEVGSLHGTILKPLLSGIYSLADKYIVMSDELKLKLLKDNIPEKKIMKIPNGVNTNLFYPYAQDDKARLKREHSLEDKNILIFSGRLVDGKGLDILLDAMKLLVCEEKTAYLLILGEGPIKSKLIAKAESLDISGSVHFSGNVTNVHEFLNMSDIFVFPSFREGMPNSLLEAMACGLPVIATKIGGVVDIIEDGKSGVLVAPGEVSDLADALKRLLKDKETGKKLGEKARERIAEHFSIDSIADKYIKLYSELMTDRL